MRNNCYIQLSVIPGDEAYKVHSIAHAAYEEFSEIDEIETEIISRLSAAFPDGNGKIYRVDRSEDRKTIGISLPSISDNDDGDDYDDSGYIVITSE